MTSSFYRRAFSLLTSSLLVAVAAPVFAACNGNEIAANAPDARFSVAGELVTDTATGLVWKHCAEGLSGATCSSGSVVIGTWADAFARVAAVNAAPATLGAGASDWRLPNRNELASLVERKCTAPSVNAAIFPATPAQSFWTSSPYAQIASLAWAVDFNVGDVGPNSKTEIKNIRLVRGTN